MQVKIYETNDHDVLESYFGEDAGDHPLVDFGERHCALIYNGPVSAVPNDGDLIVLKDPDGDFVEYFVIVKIFFIEEAHLIVARREFETGTAS